MSGGGATRAATALGFNDGAGARDWHAPTSWMLIDWAMVCTRVVWALKQKNHVEKYLHTRVKRKCAGVGTATVLISGGAGPRTIADLPPVERLQPD
jgi:hypothetical protein